MNTSPMTMAGRLCALSDTWLAAVDTPSDSEVANQTSKHGASVIRCTIHPGKVWESRWTDIGDEQPAALDTSAGRKSAYY